MDSARTRRITRVNALLAQLTEREARRKLVQSASRLIASPGMGTAYRVFALAHADVGPNGIPGFGVAPLLKADETAVARPSDDQSELPDPAAGRKLRKVKR